MNKWVWLIIAIVAEVIGTLSLKAALVNSFWYLVIVVGYGTAIFSLSRALAKGMQVGVAYGIWASAGVVLTAILAHLIFTEPLTPYMWLGIVLIIFGVLLVELGSKPKQQPQSEIGKVA